MFTLALLFLVPSGVSLLREIGQLVGVLVRPAGWMEDGIQNCAFVLYYEFILYILYS